MIKRWRESPACRQTKLFFQGIKRNETKSLLKMNRMNTRRLCRAITGHNGLNYHASKMDNMGIISPFCRLCEEQDETFYHLIKECPATLSTINLNLFWKIANTPNVELSLNLLLRLIKNLEKILDSPV